MGRDRGTAHLGPLRPGLSPAAMKAPARPPMTFPGVKGLRVWDREQVWVQLEGQEEDGLGWTKHQVQQRRQEQAGRTLLRTRLPKARFHEISGVGRVPRWETPGHPGWQVHRILDLSVHDPAYTTVLANFRPHEVPAPVSPLVPARWRELGATICCGKSRDSRRTQHSKGSSQLLGPNLPLLPCCCPEIASLFNAWPHPPDSLLLQWQ